MRECDDLPPSLRFRTAPSAAMRRSRRPAEVIAAVATNSPIRIGSDEPVATENCQLFCSRCVLFQATN